MADTAERNRIAVNIWTARFIPLVLAGVVGYATYVSIALLCVNYLLAKHNDAAAAIPILTIYFILFLLMTSSFLRLVHITVYDPPLLPLGASADRKRNTDREKSKTRSEENGIATGEYGSGGTSTETDGTRENPDAPGLELYYTKDVFTCEMDGRPRYCSSCCNWKPDRAHHCSNSGRCILKMDHFCPWVGGPIGENNFKFFVLFTFYTALYCLHLLIVMGFYIHKQVTNKNEGVNRHFCAILALATFFGLFTAGMTGTSLELIVRNETQVERLGSKSRQHTLAILKPTIQERQEQIAALAASAWYPQITYPLDARKPPKGHFSGPSPRANNTDVVQHPPPVDSIQPTQLQRAIAEEASSGEGIADSREPFSPTTGENQQDREILSSRDAKATRTFAVLKMRQGDNPWELGSARLNFESVMGTNIFDWLLPVRRSPCCNHENSESHFQIGPAVDELKRSVGFIDAKDARKGRTGRRRSSEAASTYEEVKPHRRRKRHRRSQKGDSQDSSIPKPSSGEQSEPPMEMNEMNGRESWVRG